ncbi:MAG: NAD+ synthase [Thaumarchaeota archaeon]|nr:NAD+ synthase [Nitrososphaerota archaeon]
MSDVRLPELDYDRVISEIADFIVRIVDDAGCRGVVIGLSGGLDSSVACALAVKALGRDRVTALIMPDSSVTPPRDVEDAKKLVEIFGLESHFFDIKTPYDAFAKALPFYDEAANIANANLRARLRMITLYYYANLKNLLVCGTGDRSELLLGYFTKYGDGGVDFLPIGDLYKTQVRQLARKLGLPKVIVEKPSSPALLPGQTAEGELGASYEEIDQVLYLHVDLGKSAEEIIRETGIPEDKVRAIIRRIRLNEHKRKMPPIAKISKKY